MSNLFKSQNINVLQKTMDCLWTRQRVISNNIANIDTPNYKSKTVSFEDIMADILSGDDRKAIESELVAMRPVIEVDRNAVIREDGNSVDIDSQSIELVRFTYQYQTATRQISDYISRLRYAINGG